MQCCPAVSQSPSLPWQQADTCALHPRFTEVDMALAKRPAERGSSNDPRPRCLLPTALAWLAMRASTCLESGAAHHHWECHLERPQRLVVCGPLLCDVLLPLLRCRRSKSSSVKCGAKGAERSLERNDRRQRSLISSSLHSQMARVASHEPKSRLIILRAEAGGGRTVGCGAVVGLERRQRRRYGGAVGVTALTVVLELALQVQLPAALSSSMPPNTCGGQREVSRPARVAAFLPKDRCSQLHCSN